MNRKLLSAALLALVALPVDAQRSSANSLSRARSTFTAADKDRDGSLSPREIGVAGVPTKDLRRFDLNGDGKWSKDEFVVYYHSLVKGAGLPVSADLEAETGRVRGLHRARQAEEARRRAVESRRTGKGADDAVTPEKVDRAKRGLSERLEAGGGDRTDQERLDRKLTERARAGAGAGAGASDGTAGDANANEVTPEKVDRAKRGLSERLEAGGGDRTDQERLDRKLTERARAGAGAGAGANDGTAGGANANEVTPEKVDRAKRGLSERLEAGGGDRTDQERLDRKLTERARAGAGAGAGANDGTAGGANANEVTPEKVDRAKRGLSERLEAGGGDRTDQERLDRKLTERARAGAKEGSTDSKPKPKPAETTEEALGRARARLAGQIQRGEITREEAERKYKALFDRANGVESPPAGQRGERTRRGAGEQGDDATRRRGANDGATRGESAGDRGTRGESSGDRPRQRETPTTRPPTRREGSNPPTRRGSGETRGGDAGRTPPTRRGSGETRGGDAGRTPPTRRGSGETRGGDAGRTPPTRRGSGETRGGDAGRGNTGRGDAGSGSGETRRGGGR